jgi:DNA-binding response OmpR family regulator
MNLVCPFCSAGFRAAVPEPIAQPVRLACPACKRQMVLRPPPPAQEEPRAPARRRAVIADEARPFRAFLQKELEKLGFDVYVFDTGNAVLDDIRSAGADLVIVNVHLKGKLGVEVAEEIKSTPELAGTRVALIGPLFRANRFRNDPAALYGADEYIEEQISSQALEQRIDSMFQAAGSRPPKEDAESRRLARLILSDIVSANAERVEKSVRDGTFFEALKKEIEEGRSDYNSRVPLRIRQHTEYFNEVLQEFFQLKREEL